MWVTYMQMSPRTCCSGSSALWGLCCPSAFAGTRSPAALWAMPT
uniref:Alternative protein PABPC4L n=1 Tax=Homo sapiens TaxID=9606 RepID=L8E9S0_HUMAN|nr:alternative protein PABPC4L [Homo sapiens]